MGHTKNNSPSDQFPIQVLGNFSEKKPFIIYLSGDGGWNSFSQQLGNELVQNGYTVVVFDSRKYFWDAKTPVQFVIDFETIVTYYLKQTTFKEFGVVGYSFGADVAAFIPGNLSNDLKEKIRPMVLMSPGLSTDFEVKIADLMGRAPVERKYKILTELDKTGIPILCLFGEDEALEIKAYLKESEKISVKVLSGGHRYDFDTATLVKLILEKINSVK